MVAGQLAICEQPADERWQVAFQAHSPVERGRRRGLEAERVKAERTVLDNAGSSLGCHHRRLLRLLRHLLDDLLQLPPESSDLRAPEHTIPYRLCQLDSCAWFEGSAAWSTWSGMPPTAQTSRNPAHGGAHKGQRMLGSGEASFMIARKWSTLYKA